MRTAIEGAPHGEPSIRASGRALVRWAVENPALGQLLYWRPVPGFAPTAATFDVSERQMDQLRAAFTDAAQAGQLHPSAASDEAPRLFTIVLSGLISQQMANEPAADYDTGSFTRLTDAAFDMFFARYAPQRELMQTPAHDQPAQDPLRPRGKRGNGRPPAPEAEGDR
jgi:Tetracyclin repressor-like, C-terminal domain